MFRPIISAALLALAVPAAAEPAPPPPKLVVMISVDQLSADLFAQYRRHFTGGLARMQQGGVFPSAYQAHAATETCPGHATLLTGVRPARSGIIANNWFSPGIARADKKVYCAEDVTDPASSSRDPVISARHLKVPTLGDRFKAANPASRNVAISAKDRSVVMMGGRAIDEGWWWKGNQFVSFAGKAPPPAVVAESKAAAAAIAAGAGPYAVPRHCAGRMRAVKAGSGSVGEGRFALEKDKADQFARSPRMDAATASLATRLVDTMKLGKGAATDMLAVGLSVTDYVGHTYGTEGAEMCIQMAELDRTVGRFLDHLDRRGIDYVAVLSADHGGLDLPERLDEQAYPRAVRVDPELEPKALSKVISAKTGISPANGRLILGDAPFGDFYVSASLTSEQKARVVTALVAAVRGHPQVAAVFTGKELAETPMPFGSPQDWTLKERARASFDAERSGDVVVLLDRAVMPIPFATGGTIATHGSAWDYDRRVPLLFWRKGMAGFEQPAPVETVDIAPTLAALTGLKVDDAAFDGRCLDIDAGAGNSCAPDQ